MRAALFLSLALILASSAVAGPQGRTLNLAGFSFDPVVDGEPVLHDSARTVLGGEQLHLVQFHGGVQQGWIDTLDTLGARPLQYYPHDAYLVWMDAVDVPAVDAQAFVRWRGLVHPGYKVSRELAEKNGLISNVDVLFFDDGFPQATLDALTDLGATVLNVFPPSRTEPSGAPSWSCTPTT